MAGFSRRPATRGHPSSTQDDAPDSDEYGPAFFDDRNGDNLMNEGNFPIDDYGGATTPNSAYRLQLDNPSQMLPGDDNDVDFELEEHIGSQVLDEQEHEEQQTTTDAYTQNTLDAASVLVAGFSNGNNNDRVSAVGHVRVLSGAIITTILMTK